MNSTLQTPEIRAKIRKGECVKLCDLNFYPITMSHYDEFLQCKEIITMRLSILPVKYISMNYFNALWNYELDSIKTFGSKTGVFEKLIKFLGMSLRIDITSDSLLSSPTTIFREQNDSLLIDEFTVTQNEKTIKITSSEFSQKIRSLVALQNGLVLPNENENADLIRANDIKKTLNADSNIKFDIEQQISAVAYNSHIPEKEIWNWTVREFINRDNAIERDKKYHIYAQAELSGMVTFKNGNPVPSWRFDVCDNTLGTRQVSEIGNLLNGKQKK